MSKTKNLTLKQIGGPVKLCPKCGKLGCFRDFKNDTMTMYYHKGKIGVFGFVEITESCIVRTN